LCYDIHVRILIKSVKEKVCKLSCLKREKSEGGSFSAMLAEVHSGDVSLKTVGDNVGRVKVLSELRE